MANEPKSIQAKSIQTWGKKVRYLGAAHSVRAQRASCTSPPSP